MALWLATAAALALWGSLVLALALATRNPVVVPGPPTGALAAEPPAVVDLITGGWRLCEEATSATLLDLAARGAVQIEEIGPELSLVRLRRPEGLNAYERLVYEHVAALARDGVVATGALAEGSRNLSRWWRSFRRKVVADARERGLSRARWSRWQVLVITVAAAVPAGLAGFAAALLDTKRDAGLGTAVLLFAALVALAGRLNGERGTEQGARAAAHWLGVRDHLATARFHDKPAAAVTIWGRPLAYAAALGLAPRAVTSLPVSVPADDRRAWSDYGGMWHRVEVDYPSRLIRGRRPLHVFGRGLAAGFFAGFWTWVALIALSAFELVPSGLPRPGALLVGVLVAAVPAVRAVLDLASPAELEGQVVRLRSTRTGRNNTHLYWCAIDEGHSRRVTAFGIAGDQWSGLSEGDVVRARAGRRVGWISEIRVLRPARAGESYDDTREIAAPENLGEARRDLF